MDRQEDSSSSPVEQKVQTEASFPDKLRGKLERLKPSQESVQTLCEWILFHKNKCKEAVEIWRHEFEIAPQPSKLAFLFLCNDLVQNSRKHGPGFRDAFQPILPEAIDNIYNYEGSGVRDRDKTRATVDKTIAVWAQRNIFSASFISSLCQKIGASEPKEVSKKRKAKTGTTPKQEHQHRKKTRTTASDTNVADERSEVKHPVVALLTELETHAKMDAMLFDSGLKKLVPQLPTLTDPDKIKMALEATRKLHARICARLETRRALQRHLESCLSTQSEEIETRASNIQDIEDSVQLLHHRVVEEGLLSPGDMSVFQYFIRDEATGDSSHFESEAPGTPPGTPPSPS